MSLIFGYPHTVTVTTMKAVKDLAGVNEIVADRVFEVPCKVEPVSSTDAGTKMKVLCDSWPGGISSVVEWRGRKFNQEGEAAEHDAGYFTRGATVLIVAQNAVLK